MRSYQNIVKVCESYLKKGAKVYIEGQLETRSWEQDGQKKYSTEIVLRPFRGELTMLDSKGGGSSFQDNSPPPYESGGSSSRAASGGGGAPAGDFEDEIPF